MGRFGLRLWDRAPGPEPTSKELALVARIAAQLEELDALTAAWREADRVVELEDVVCVEIGAPDAEGLDTLADDYTRKTGAPFPALLHALWSKLNGVAVFSTDGHSTVSVVPPRELSEPALWPVNVWGEHWWEVDPHAHLFVIGGLPDSGSIALRVVDASPDPEVVWIGRNEDPRLIARSLAAYLEAWAGAAFCLPLVLRRARVPGWGA
ncbi:SMI1/KNR4 family protein [Polyangium sp. 15x6]|uniref:SMI1/KNR4 family protein n=1 Tax=Polyangium sp. 15x6 TaxID=3042687 RepID=UPI00249CBD35|nr:SMI1/KNR4 family protein [Polyangium sp. 15x6]MDI3288791.1 SMI1/KNR4 family protein [Polyangium sp. 15x6]